MEETFSTKDLYFAGFLQVKGCRIIELQKTEMDGRKSLAFVFSDKEKCRELEAVFWNKENTPHEDLSVNVKEYTNILRDLKSRVFSAMNPQS